MPNTYQTVRPDGCKEIVEATDTSTGVAEAGDIVALNPQGVIDETLLPPGIGADVKSLEASEDIGAGDFVNIFDDGGTPKIRLADNSNGRVAHGFVRSAILTGASGDVYFEGKNDALTGLTLGDTYYLGTSGDVTTTPPDLTSSGTAAGTILQPLGTACGLTEINVELGEKILKG